MSAIRNLRNKFTKTVYINHAFDQPFAFAAAKASTATSLSSIAFCENKCQDIKGLIEDCDNDVYEAAKLYVEEAFKIEDIYDIAVDIKKIKQLMKNNNVINLQKANEPDAYAGDSRYRHRHRN